MDSKIKYCFFFIPTDVETGTKHLIIKNMAFELNHDNAKALIKCAELLIEQLREVCDANTGRN